MAGEDRFKVCIHAYVYVSFTYSYSNLAFLTPEDKEKFSEINLITRNS